MINFMYPYSVSSSVLGCRFNLVISCMKLVGTSSWDSLKFCHRDLSVMAMAHSLYEKQDLSKLSLVSVNTVCL